MQCQQCHGPLDRVEKDGRIARGCRRCRWFWVTPDFTSEAELRSAWIQAQHVDPLPCPGCEALRLQLGSLGNRTVYRCGACSRHFVTFAPLSAAEAAGVLGWIGADLLASFFP